MMGLGKPVVPALNMTIFGSKSLNSWGVCNLGWSPPSQDATSEGLDCWDPGGLKMKTSLRGRSIPLYNQLKFMTYDPFVVETWLSGGSRFQTKTILPLANTGIVGKFPSNLCVGMDFLVCAGGDFLGHTISLWNIYLKYLAQFWDKMSGNIPSCKLTVRPWKSPSFLGFIPWKRWIFQPAIC